MHRRLETVRSAGGLVRGSAQRKMSAAAAATTESVTAG